MPGSTNKRVAAFLQGVPRSRQCGRWISHTYISHTAQLMQESMCKIWLQT